MRRHLVGLQIVSDVGKDLVDGIDVDVLGRDVLQVDAVYLTTNPYILCHPWRCSDVVSLPIGVNGQLRSESRFSRERLEADGLASLIVHLSHLLYHLEKSGPAAHPIGLQRGRHR